MSTNNKDSICWKGKKDGILTVKSCYTLLLNPHNATSVWALEKKLEKPCPLQSSDLYLVSMQKCMSHTVEFAKKKNAHLL